MCVAAAAAIISTGASIAGQVISFGAQNKRKRDFPRTLTPPFGV